MIKNLSKLLPYMVWAAGVLLSVSCVKETADDEARQEEQRYFDIYLASHYPDAIPEPSGLYYIENKAGTGDMPGDSTWVLVDHVSYLIPEEQVYDTYIENVAVDNNLEDTAALYGPYKIRNGFLNEGFTEGLSMMREGGEATFLFTSDLGYGSQKAGSVGPYQSLKYEIRLLEVLGDDIESYEATRILAYADTIQGADTIYDAETGAIMYFVVDSATTGAPVAIDSTIQVAYKGYLLDGRVFDETKDDNYYEFKVGDYESGTSPIVGWHLGLQRFREGEKGRLIIPYQLAYGEFGKHTNSGNVAIPVYESLVFDVEVVSVTAGDEDVHPSTE
jgi:FKBP-type peptidyl-prolyl cis-trans isomerase FkpA